jgi:adenosylmethionine-8-amino-7-oxononanoate aminotransferase
MIAREDMGEVFYGPGEADVNFAHGHTFAANPLGCAVGLAVIDEIVSQRLAERARELGQYLAGKLEGLKQYGVVREVRGRGLLLGVELVKDTGTMAPFPELGRALKKTSLDNGLIMRIDPTWFAVAPALIAEREELDELYELIDRSLLDALEMVS